MTGGWGRTSRAPVPTSKKNGVLLFIEDFTAKQFYAPTMREIATAMDIKSTSTVHGILRDFEKQGRVMMGRGPRTLRVLP